MLTENQGIEQKFEFVCIDQLVPEEHLLRKISKYIDFKFIYEKCRHLYCKDNGRPSLDPIIFFKTLFIGYLFGIRSERQLVKEIEVNVAYRWFLGMGLSDKVIHHSTLSQSRKRRFKENGIYQEIFDEIVYQAVKHNMVGGEVLYTDSTHLKANANKKKFIKEQVKESTHSYFGELDKAINTSRVNHNKKPFSVQVKIKEKTIKKSTTDPDSGYMCREGKPEGFHYLDHRTVDGKSNIIIDVHVTAGNVNDAKPYLKRLDYQIKKFGFIPKAVGLDAGYNTASICHGLEQRGIKGAIGYRRPNGNKDLYYVREYKYIAEKDEYICPAGKPLKYSTTSRSGFREYKSNAKECKNCPYLSKCTKSKNHIKIITRHVWEESKRRTREYTLSTEGKEIYRRRKETIERSFAESKELYGYRYARFRGIMKVNMQSLLTAVVQNMKKIAITLWRRENKGKIERNKSNIFMILHVNKTNIVFGTNF